MPSCVYVNVHVHVLVHVLVCVAAFMCAYVRWYMFCIRAVICIFLILKGNI